MNCRRGSSARLGGITSIIMLLCIVSISYAGLSGSNHDFRLGIGGSNFAGEFSGDNDETCVYCHTPHAASSVAGMQPLWNKSNAGTAFTPYTSSTMDALTPVSISPVSLLCLSCHDGVGAINSVLNSPGTGNPGITDGGFNAIGQLGPLAMPVNIGGLSAPGNMDLSNDHPVSIAWPGGDTGLNPVGSIDSRLKLRNGMVECTTCHDPHDNGTGIAVGEVEFLVMSNAGSAMCLSCHNK